MKLMINIANYGTTQLPYLNRIIDNISKFNYDCDIFIDSTVKITHSINPHVVLHDIKIGQHLVWAHRKRTLDNINNYDAFIYLENDILITQYHLDYYFSLCQEIDQNEYMPGLLRYEECNNEHTLVDLNDYYPGMNFDVILLNNKRFFYVKYPHQGLYILTKQQLKKCIDNHSFDVNSVGSCKRGFGILESAATEPLTSYKKIIPIDDIKKSYIHHMSNKYIKTYNRLNTKLLEAKLRK